MSKKLFVIISLSLITISGLVFFANQAKAAPSITITSPNGGETWEQGKTYDITWDQASIDKLTIYLLSDSTTYEAVYNHVVDISAISGSYSYTVPTNVPTGSNYKLWIIAYQTGIGQTQDYSDDYFSVVEASTSSTSAVTVTSPNGGEQWEKGKSYNISWDIDNDNLIGNGMTLHLSKEGDSSFSYTINPSQVIKSTGIGSYQYSWTIPDWLESRTDYKIGIVLEGSAGIQSFSDVSDAPFSIVTGQTCTDTDNGDDFYTKGYRIHYYTSHYGYGIESWDYCISNPDLSSSGEAIADSAKKVTECSGDKCYIIEYHCKTDLSDAHDSYQCPYGCQDGACFESVNGSCGSANGRYFASQPTTNLCSAGNATDVSIRWKDGYNVGYAWACNGIGETADDVSCVAYRTPSDSSITVLSPNGGEKLITGQTFIIKWLSSGIEGDVQLEFCIGALPGYRTCSPIKPSDATTYVGVPNTGLYDWEVPFRGTDAGAIYTINVWGINEFDSKVIGSSDAPFSIVEAGTPSVNITSPTSASTYWRKGETHTVYWTLKNFTDAQCDIELYKINIASLARSIAINYSANQVFNNYSWTVPDDLEAGQYKTSVRCHNQDETITYEDKSDNYFSVIEAGAISPPTNVAVTGVETNQGKGLKISWVNPSDTSVRIYRSTTQNQLGNEYYSSLSTDTLFIDYNVSSNVTYYYTIHSYKEGNESTNTDQYSGNLSTPTPTPTPTECLPDGTLIKLPDDPKIYVIINCQKKWIETIEEFEQEEHQWSDVQETSSEVISAYADYLEATANLIRAANQANVYKIINNKRLWIPTAESFTAMGNNWSDIQDVNESEVNQYLRLKLAKIAGDEKIYYLTEGGLKRHIPSVEAFNSYGNNWEDIVEITSTELNTYPDSVLIRLTDDPKVYKLENNQKRWIKTIEAFNRLGLNWNEIAPVNTTEIDAYTEGEEIE